MGSYPIYKSETSFFLMFIKNYRILFSSTLLIGTLISVSANRWFTAWLGLEINLISIIPLMLIKLNFKFTEASIKYFIVQAIASIIIIFSISINFLSQETYLIELNEFFLISSLSIKAGFAPLHFWLPQVIEALDWFQCIILFSWQKIAPLILICALSFKLLFIISALSALVGALGGFNQKYFKLILAYSSISHRGWIILRCCLQFNTWLTYFSIYCLLSFSIILFLWSEKTNKINDIFSSLRRNINKKIFILNIISLGGLPPLLGFSAKLNIILSTVRYNNIIIFIPLIIRSLISLYYYTRLAYSFLTNKSSQMFIFKNNINKPLTMFFTLRLFINILLPLIFII